MNRRYLVALSVGITLTLGACHKKAPNVAPTPMTGQQGTAQPPAAPPSSSTSGNPAANGGNSSGANDATGTARMNTLTERIHFEYNVSDIRPEDQTRLDAKAALMKQFPSLKIRITGHADERGSDEYNVALGSRRAGAAKDYLVRIGIDGSRIDVASLGREQPIDRSGTEAAFSANRRDEFEITAGSQSLRTP